MQTAVQLTEHYGRGAAAGRDRSDAMAALAVRVQGEYREMPGLRLTLRQAARLFGIAQDDASAVLDDLRRASFLTLSTDGAYSLVTEPSRRVTASLRDASVNRLACLLRHWTWANEAMETFDRELAVSWNDDDDPLSDHPFGAFYRWCALLCALSEEALEHGLLSHAQLDTIRTDLEATLPDLRTCRQLLVAIPESLEEHPRVIELLRDDHVLPRLRRVHHAFGDALRQEHVSREIDSLDV